MSQPCDTVVKIKLNYTYPLVWTYEGEGVGLGNADDGGVPDELLVRDGEGGVTFIAFSPLLFSPLPPQGERSFRGMATVTDRLFHHWHSSLLNIHKKRTNNR